MSAGAMAKQNDELIVNGHLREQNGVYQMVFSWHGGDIPKGSKQRSTGLSVKGNKRRAHTMLDEKKQKLRNTLIEKSRRSQSSEAVSFPSREHDDHSQSVTKTTILNFEKRGSRSIITSNMLFSEYLKVWLNRRRISLEPDSWAGDFSKVKVISHYFTEMELTVAELTEYDIEDFYTDQIQRGKSNNTVRAYHVIINKALKDLFLKKEILYNPAELVTNKPRLQKYVGKSYNVMELQKLCIGLKGNLLEFAVYCAGYYGLRRSEIDGLQWDNFDFERNIFLINPAYISFYLEGEHVEYLKERPKNNSSVRALPMVPPFKEMLLRMKADQERCRKLCGNCYNQKYLNYVNVDQMGNLIKPDYLTSGFKNYIKQKNFKVIRFHDLRHTCASILYEYGVDMKKISRWLGHSSTLVTETVYSHFLSDPFAASQDVLMQTWA